MIPIAVSVCKPGSGPAPTVLTTSSGHNVLTTSNNTITVV